MPDCPLAYEVEGAGAPVVLLHAFPLSHAMWRETCKRLAGRYRVIVPDLPGFDGSPRRLPTSIADMARAVIALLDRLEVREPVALAGLSMGGYVAFEMLREAPQRIRALGLCSTRAAADTPEQRQSRRWAIERIARDGLEPFVRGMLPRLLGRTTLATRPALGDQVLAQALANTPGGVMDALQAMAERADSTALLSAIRCPTLIIAGDEDTVVPITETEALNRRLPGSRLVVLSQAGHLVNLEQPDAFHAALERLLEELPGSCPHLADDRDCQRDVAERSSPESGL